ncbi:MAG TPA: thioredoxin family protein, partial [Chloroflexia bacterium]|nr:thioredoxin family protein [Chloroflexia bacterium]
MTITAEQFGQGMRFPAYMAQMRDNQEAFAANYAAFQITAADQEVISRLDRPLQVLILTEDWCGDSLLYLPVLGRLGAAAPNWDLRVFLRDQHLDLADQYLNQGKWRSVPVVVFYDHTLHELGRFIEHPALARQERQTLIDHVAREHPAVQAGRPYNDQSDA